MGRHDLDVMSLVSGGVFVVLGALFLLHFTVGFALELRLVWPVLLIGIGVAVLLGSRPR